MMAVAIIGPILLIVGIVTLLFVVKNAGRMRMGKTFHWKLIIGYLMLLAVLLIIAEVMERNYKFEQPFVVSASESEFDVMTAIRQDLPIPERLIVEKRTHEVEQKFSIAHIPVEAFIVIERTSDESLVIQETVYKPKVLLELYSEENAYYDLSDGIKVKLPVWDKQSMYLPQQPINQVRYTFYQDSGILNQFSEKPMDAFRMGTISSMLVIHLLVPTSIDLEVPEFTDEFERYTIEFL